MSPTEALVKCDGWRFTTVFENVISTVLQLSQTGKQVLVKIWFGEETSDLTLNASVHFESHSLMAKEE